MLGILLYKGHPINFDGGQKWHAQHHCVKVTDGQLPEIVFRKLGRRIYIALEDKGVYTRKDVVQSGRRLGLNEHQLSKPLVQSHSGGVAHKDDILQFEMCQLRAKLEELSQLRIRQDKMPQGQGRGLQRRQGLAPKFKVVRDFERGDLLWLEARRAWAIQRQFL